MKSDTTFAVAGWLGLIGSTTAITLLFLVLGNLVGVMTFPAALVCAVLTVFTLLAVIVRLT